MMLRKHLLALAVLMAAVPLLGQQHPNVERGFQADKVYQFGGIDSVNLYNGNLSLTIPIGGAYSGNGALKYRLALVYNSKAWEEEIHTFENPLVCDGSGGPPPPECFKPYVKTTPSKASNAGMGWSLSLGRLLGPIEAGPGGVAPYFIYEGPDGAQHFFGQNDAAAGSAVRHTTDGSFLRISYVSVSENYEVHFPDGIIQSFGLPLNSSSYRLEQIRDLFGNHLDIDYGSGAGGTWTLSEHDATTLVRQHYVHFRDMSLEPVPPENVPPNYQFAVREIDLAAFGDARATYALQYTVDEILYDCFGDSRPYETPNPKVPRLHHIINPDGSQWDADYFYDGCSGISQLVLPTKGKMEWTYTNYGLDTAVCPEPLNFGDLGQQHLSIVRGVEKKKVVNNGETFTWTYTQSQDEHVIWSCSQSGATSKARQSTVTVLSPDGRKTEHYFSIWNEAPLGNNFFDRSEYGLPFTRGTGSGCAAAFSSSEFCLSSREYDCSSGQCSSTPARSHYVRYEGDSRYSATGTEGYGYRREVARRTVFHDEAERHVDVVRSSYDGLGHFRKVVTSDSWSGLSREETTEYNPAQDDVTVDPSNWENDPPNNRPGWPVAWLLNLFDATEVSENGTTEKAEFCFDSNNGRLKRRRTLAGTGRQSKDLLAIFGHTQGNLTSERYFGGDATPLSSGFDTDTCSTAVDDNDLGAYSLTHAYASGARKTTQYAGVLFNSLDLTIDGNTGLPSASKDTSLLQTDYSYDKQGRLTSAKPPAQAWTQYVYDTTATPPTVVIKQWANGAAASGTPLTERRFYFDGFGLVRQARAKMTENWSVTKNTYDAFGNTKTSSMPEYQSSGAYDSTFNPIRQQSFDYDFLGRVKKVTAPDGKQTTIAYHGKRVIRNEEVVGQFTTRTVDVATSTAGETPSTTIEKADGLGRIRSVIEPNGTISTYGYDAGGRLTSVTMDNQVPADQQSRTFRYDGRGVLTDETHPEIGTDGKKTITYDRYDARGHVLRKLVGNLSAGATASDFDLKYEYDGAERPVKQYQILNRQNDSQSSIRLLKEFNYASEDEALNPVNRRRGKLDNTVRYNYPLSLTNQGFPPASGTFVVTETFRYQNDAGTLSSRGTRIQHDSGTPPRTLMHEATQKYAYNDLGLTTSLHYPECSGSAPCTMGAPLGTSTPLTNTYTDGRLSSISGYATSLKYHATGMLSEVVHGQNGGVNVADTYTADSGMPRPASITFTGWDDCVPPAPVINVVAQVCPSSTGNIASVTVVSGASYLWEITNGNGSITSGATSAEMHFTAGVSGAVALRVTVSTTSCGSGTDTRSVAIAQPTAQIVSGNTTINPGQSTTIQVALTGTAPWSITWMPGSVVQSNITSSPASRLVTPAATTTYTLSAVSDANCAGTPSSNSVTVTVAAPLQAPAGFYTSKVGKNSKDVILRWNVVSGATSYRIERAPQIGAWSPITPACQQIGGVMQCSDSFTSSIPSPVAYVYRVIAVANTLESGPSGMDYATVADLLFTDEPLLANATAIRGRHVGELRAAIDAVRVAANLPRKWGSYAALSGSILATHFYNAQYVNNLSNATDLRNVLDEAVLAIVGTRITYSLPAPAAGAGIFAYQVEEIRTGVK